VQDTSRIDPVRVHELLSAHGCPWPAPSYLPTTGSTNADAAQLVRQGAPDGSCVVAGEQTAGRGRHGRHWVSDPGAGLWLSTVLRGVSDPTRVPPIAALAVRDVARQLGDLQLSIKWPNDVLATDGRKIAGILAEVVGDAVVVGIGINVDYSASALPDEAATSWFLETGQHPNRSDLLAGLLVRLFERGRLGWPALLDDYRAACVTLGARVRVSLPGGEEFEGVGEALDESGHLVVRSGQSLRTVVAGDVIHATITT